MAQSGMDETQMRLGMKGKSGTISFPLEAETWWQKNEKQMIFSLLLLPPFSCQCGPLMIQTIAA
jgi:hypothetical protein